MKNRLAQVLLATVATAIFFPLTPVGAVEDGFGDGDRNNDGAITKYDSDTIVSALDADDTGLIWNAAFGHTSSGDRKTYISIIDDSNGDADSPGLQSGYALGCEGKGSSTSFVGLLTDAMGRC